MTEYNGLERSSATEELRCLLDERGARWIACSKAIMDNQTFCYGHTYTEFQGGLMVSDLTPKQAIEATLGRGTCHDESGGDPCVFVCSACKATRDHSEDQPFNYCPNCGRKVK